MKTIWKGLPVFLFCLVLLVSCSKPLVGKQVSYDSPMVGRIGSGGECTVRTKHFDFHCTVKKTEAPDTYVLEGKADYKGASIWTNLSQPMFILLPVRKGKIIDYISFVPGSHVLGQNIPIRRTFSCPGGFDAVMIGYRVIVTDGDSPI